MEHITVGIKKNASKVALVACVKNGPLNNLDSKDKCFFHSKPFENVSFCPQTGDR